MNFLILISFFLLKVGMKKIFCSMKVLIQNTYVFRVGPKDHVRGEGPVGYNSTVFKGISSGCMVRNKYLSNSKGSF